MTKQSAHREVGSAHRTSSRKKLRRQLEAIKHELVQLHEPTDDEIKLIFQHRPELAPLAALAACNVDHLIDLVGYKPVMRALTKLLQAYKKQLRLQLIERVVSTRKIKSRALPLPVEPETPVLDEDLAIPLATSVAPRATTGVGHE